MSERNAFELYNIGAWVNSKLSGRNPPLYHRFEINHHAGTTKHNNYKRHDKLEYSSVCYIGSSLYDRMRLLQYQMT